MFFREYSISIQQEQPKQEVEIVNNLPATIHKNKGLGAIISNLLHKIGSNLLHKIISIIHRDPEVVATVPYKEVDTEKEKFSKELGIEQTSFIEEKITQENLNDLLNEMRNIIDNEKIIKPIKEKLKQEVQQGQTESFCSGKINGKKYIAFKGFYGNGLINGDVVVLMDNHCYLVKGVNAEEAKGISCKEIMFNNKNKVLDEKGLSACGNWRSVLCRGDIEKTGLPYYCAIRTLNEYEIWIQLEDENYYNFYYNSKDEFIKGVLPYKIESLYVIYKKKEDSKEYESFKKYINGQGEKIESDCSYDSIINSIKLQKDGEGKDIADYCPREFIDMVKNGFEIVPSDIVHILRIISPDLERRMRISRVQDKYQTNKLKEDDGIDK